MADCMVQEMTLLLLCLSTTTNLMYSTDAMNTCMVNDTHGLDEDNYLDIRLLVGCGLWLPHSCAMELHTSVLCCCLGVVLGIGKLLLNSKSVVPILVI